MSLNPGLLISLSLSTHTYQSTIPTYKNIVKHSYSQCQIQFPSYSPITDAAQIISIVRFVKALAGSVRWLVVWSRRWTDRSWHTLSSCGCRRLESSQIYRRLELYWDKHDNISNWANRIIEARPISLALQRASPSMVNIVHWVSGFLPIKQSASYLPTQLPT